ncbi:MAG: hypothetical protein IT190_06440 [Microbacteriaceae bacterium]|nr:hypothetical protein [Microbacteriaceae bacterium]
MISSEDTFTLAVAAARSAAARVPDQLADVRELDDGVLLASQRELSELRRIVDARSSLVAGEIAYRSRRELGYTGLAQKQGFQSAEKLIQSATGSSRRDATTLVTAGTLVHEAMIADSADPDTGEIPEGFSVREPWLAAVGAAVAKGLLTIDAARAIRSGLGEPRSDGPGGSELGSSELGCDGSGVTAAALAGAVDELLLANDHSPNGLNSDELYRRARDMRDELDEAGIAQREQVLYSQRSLRRTMRPNGLSRYTLDPDLEMSAWLDDVYDKLTSPRRGGPRFVDAGDREWSEAIATDTRSTEQYLHDAFMGILHKGVDTDLTEAQAAENNVGSATTGTAKSGTAQSGTAQSGTAQFGTAQSGTGASARRRPRIIGSRVPAVRVLVTEEALRSRTGHGRIEGSDIPVSIESVERAVCLGGTIFVGVDKRGNIIDLGRESRLFTTYQKVALAVRDGGCMFDGCDRAAGWTEAHHINHWARDGGKTDVADGILLCRHHHMLVHNNHWEIVRKDGAYWLIPPPDIDREQTPRKLVSKSAVMRDFRREQRLRDSA